MHSDKQLIRKIKAHQSREAADELIGRYYKEIYAYAYRQTGDRELAMDLTQDIFIAILQGLDTFDGQKAQFRTWAYRVAANKITDYYRSRAHRQKMLETAWFAEDGEDEAFRYVAEYENGRISELVLNRDLIRRVMETVMQFDTEWVRIFQKKCFEERTFAEIADEMQLSENTVKTRFYKMIRKVRKEVAEKE